jgi:hypothetical protein
VHNTECIHVAAADCAPKLGARNSIVKTKLSKSKADVRAASMRVIQRRAICVISREKTSAICVQAKLRSDLACSRRRRQMHCASFGLTRMRRENLRSHARMRE